MAPRHAWGVYSIQDLLSTVSVLWSVEVFVNPLNGKSLQGVDQEQENICLTYRLYQLKLGCGRRRIIPKRGAQVEAHI